MARTLHSIRGATRLAFDCLGGVAGMVEQLHATIARRPSPWAPPGETLRPGPVASTVYGALRGTHALLREGVDRSLAALAEAVDATPAGEDPPSFASALNGICGDHLEATGNALAIPMGFRTAEAPLEPAREALAAALPEATSKVVVLIHGLCLSERAWIRPERSRLGERLREALGYTPLYLRYNTGRRISTNGRELAERLEALLAAWPVPVESLALVGHSMGGLVIRSAGRYADCDGRAWRRRLHRVAFLGTPHHGSPLEKGGHRLTLAMRASPYVDPFALGRIRSAGIQDLRHGSLLDEDWQGQDRERPHADSRKPVPLLEGVEYYCVAATVGRSPTDPRGRLLGDLLVGAGSAVGSHPDAQRRLRLRPENCRVFHRRHHFDLLSDAAVHRQLVEWFGAAQGS